MITYDQFKYEVTKAIRNRGGVLNVTPTTIYVSENVWFEIIEDLSSRPMSWQIVPCNDKEYMGLKVVTVCENNYLKIH
jgi:hypothetical protein